MATSNSNIDNVSGSTEAKISYQISKDHERDSNDFDAGSDLASSQTRRDAHLPGSLVKKHLFQRQNRLELLSDVPDPRPFSLSKTFSQSLTNLTSGFRRPGLRSQPSTSSLMATSGPRSKPDIHKPLPPIPASPLSREDTSAPCSPSDRVPLTKQADLEIVSLSIHRPRPLQAPRLQRVYSAMNLPGLFRSPRRRSPPRPSPRPLTISRPTLISGPTPVSAPLLTSADPKLQMPLFNGIDMFPHSAVKQPDCELEKLNLGREEVGAEPSSLRQHRRQDEHAERLEVLGRAAAARADVDEEVDDSEQEGAVDPVVTPRALGMTQSAYKRRAVYMSESPLEPQGGESSVAVVVTDDGSPLRCRELDARPASSLGITTGDMDQGEGEVEVELRGLAVSDLPPGQVSYGPPGEMAGGEVQSESNPYLDLPHWPLSPASYSSTSPLVHSQGGVVPAGEVVGEQGEGEPVAAGRRHWFSLRNRAGKAKEAKGLFKWTGRRVGVEVEVRAGVPGSTNFV